MASYNIELTRHQDELIAALVESGRYVCPDEVIRDGLRLLEQREREDLARIESLRRAAQDGIDAIESGDARSFANFDELLTHLDRLTEDAIASAGHEPPKSRP